MPSDDLDRDRTLMAIVLLGTAPHSVGEVLADAHPILGERAEAQPELGRQTELTTTVNGHELRFAVAPPETSESFRLALSESLVRTRVEAGAADHRSTVVVSTPVGAGIDPYAAHELLSYLAAGLLDRDDATAIWLPHQGQVTTDVLFIGELERRSAHTWFRSMAMWLDQGAGTSHAFTEGLGAFGSLDVQWSGVTLPPQEAWTALRTAIADLLEARTIPTPGLSLEVAGVRHVLVAGTDLARGTPVLDLVPDAAAPAPAERPEGAPEKKRRWFGRG